jgi:hypothetical protein
LLADASFRHNQGETVPKIIIHPPKKKFPKYSLNPLQLYNLNITKEIKVTEKTT